LKHLVADPVRQPGAAAVFSAQSRSKLQTTNRSFPRKILAFAKHASPESKIVAGFGLALAVLMAAGVVQHRAIHALTETEGWVARTHAVLTELAGANSGLQQAESGTRGYVATGQERYVRMHDAGVSDAQQHLHSIRALTADNPKQQQALNVLLAQAAAKLAVMQRLINLRRDSGFAAAQQVLLQGEGFRLMDQTLDPIHGNGGDPPPGAARGCKPA
jgi:CHASE3 domain sensor protein